MTRTVGGNATLSKQYQKAISYYEKALTINRKIEDAATEGRLLHELGDVYLQLKQYDKASSHYESALTIIQRTKERHHEAVILRSLGRTYESMSQHEKSASYLLRSVAISRKIKDRNCEALTLDLLMKTWKSADKSRLGVFYGKQAVNTIQSIRSDIRTLDQDLQKSYLKSIEYPYHTLAEILIAQGRLSEAEQVLGLLKEQEFFDYIRRDTAEAATLNRRVGLTAEEAEWEKRYAIVGDRLVTIGTQRGELRAKKSLTSEETARLTQLEQDLALGNQAFEKFLGELTTNFSAKPALANRVEELRETQGIMEDLRELPAGTVAIYTLMGGEKLSVILRTPDTVKAYE